MNTTNQPVDPQHAIVPAGLAIEAEHWRYHRGAVVALLPRRSLGVRGSDEYVAEQGGHLVAESCGPRDGQALAAVPRLLRALRLCSGKLFALEGLSPEVREAIDAYRYAIEGK